ncbi:lysophospholipase [Flagelloscypha sp. PMI_526]|nr:lysophospholipase [Flagelloscypha sp. PMI_526]
MSTTKSYVEEWQNGPLNTRFYTRTYQPPSNVALKAVLVFVHGFSDYIGRYLDAHTYYASEGVLVFSWDQRGFGLTALDKKNKSSNSSYGVTGGWDQQMADISWALDHAKLHLVKDDVPIFLMGHSMGGGEVLGYATQDPPPAQLSNLRGIIGSSPCILQTHPANKWLRTTGAAMSNVFPNMYFPAAVPTEHVTKDKDIVAALKKDPLVLPKGTLLGLTHMLRRGEELLEHRYKKWPKSLHLLILHGTADEVTSHAASSAFYEKVDVEIKQLQLFEGAYHEPANDPDSKQSFLNTVVGWIGIHCTK